ncbi:MAG: hypothetical protein JWO78_1172 [Micavibrio sp.]|nr:hypothetical protein [Micavibrio sp.]
MKTTLLFLAAALWLTSATPLSAQQLQQPVLQTPGGPEIMLSSDSDEADADKVSSLIDTMANNVRACIKTRQASPQECQCKFTDNLGRIKTAYDSALRLHPDWDGKRVSYKKGTAPIVSVSFAGLKKQFEACENPANPR